MEGMFKDEQNSVAHAVVVMNLGKISVMLKIQNKCASHVLKSEAKIF